MEHTAEAIAHGAATVVNAISTGKGAAIGVDLWTRARVELNGAAGRISASIEGDPDEATNLMITVVRGVLQRYRASREFGAHVQTESNIPIARGMKSSSVAANAVALAATAALGKRIRDQEIIKSGVDAAVSAGVTITGAFDDASASYYGGFIVTDNKRRKIIKRGKISENYAILFHVPPEKSYTAHVDLNKFRKLAHVSMLAYNLALNGHCWEALTLNGLAHAVVLGWEPGVAIEAMTAGAIASGLSGKGPATVAIVRRNLVHRVRSAMSQFEGKLIETRPNNRKAKVVAKTV